ncbi:MAG: hypothetical protein HRU20_19420 [Pseudomonadales bacterium]|nr:hypothetical protein [Pseudomonadales bacterium]
MQEYGRGPIITALPFSLADSLISLVELKSFYLSIKELGTFVPKDGFK